VKEFRFMQQQSFDALCAFLKRSSGLILDQSKQYLVESRVLPIVKREKLGGLGDLALILERGQNAALAKEVIEAMTINETYFFRDRTPFDKFRDVVLPRVISARQNERTLRVWCAASSTGQEPYSLAMIMDELAHKTPGWRVELVATDLAEAQLAKARSATYTQFEVQRGLSTAYLLRYFTQHGDSWQAIDALRNRVQFRQFNLLSDFAILGRFDIIFCRNVLIYFDVATKSDILKRMTRILAPDGALFLGASESVIGLGTDLMPDAEHRAFHTRVGAAAAPLKPVVAPTAVSPVAKPGAVGAQLATVTRLVAR
jgi:chemotaxis protein methyltransferase CheR